MIQDLYAIRFLGDQKVSHDYSGSEIQMFSYKDMFARQIPFVGVPCRQNNIIVIDVDVEGPTHKKDGTEFWNNFCIENSMPWTYTVKTRSGGYHFYYKLPAHINPETFSPPGELSPGCDVKWNGWVAAPPTAGYTIHYGNVQEIIEVPRPLLDYLAGLIHGKPSATFQIADPTVRLGSLHTPFSDSQLMEISNRIDWMQTNATLSRQEWRDGLFALKAGVSDPVMLDDLACRWTMNRAYAPGDEEQARAIIDRADPQGPVGPGTIFSIMAQVQVREGAPVIISSNTPSEIFDKARIPLALDKQGKITVEPTESNAAAIIGATFDNTELYHDIRQDLFIFKGKSHSDTQLVNTFIPMLQSPAFGLGLEKFRKQAISAGLDVLMAQRPQDPHLDFLKTIRWDGVRRVGKFFTTYAGVPSSQYIDLVGTNLWVSLAARGLSPGCKLDSMVVLEGREGIAKSSFVEAIGGTYTFAPSSREAFTDLDQLRQMHQAAIVELPEMVGLAGQDAKIVKSFITKPFDNIRGLYARKAMRAERGFVLVGTTNDAKYLTLEMGARRFWPVKIPKSEFVKIHAIREDREQLFAEAVQMYRDGHPFWHMPKELLDPHIDARVVDEPLLTPIKELLDMMGPIVTTSEIYRRLETTAYVTKGFTPQLVFKIETAMRMLKVEKNDAGEWENPFCPAMQSFNSGIPKDFESYV